jgi:hypothetical protein
MTFSRKALPWPPTTILLFMLLADDAAPVPDRDVRR